MSKFRIKTGEAETDVVEVDFDAIEVPDGHHLLTQAGLDAMIGNRVGKEQDKAKRDREKALKDQKIALMGDDDVFAEIAKQRGIKLDGDKKVISEVSPEHHAELKKGWEDQELAPIRDELETARGQLNSVRLSALHREIQAAAIEAGVRKAVLLNPDDPDAPSGFVRDIAARAKWDDDGNYYFEDPATGGQMTNVQTGKRVSAKDRVEMVRKKDKDFTFFEDARPKDTKTGGKTTSGGGQNQDGKPSKVSRNDFEAMNANDKMAYQRGWNFNPEFLD